MSTPTTNINAKYFVDSYTDWKFPNKTDKEEPARIDCRYDFAVTLSNGSLLTAIGALALGILRVLSPMLALVLVGVSAIIYWQMNEKIHPFSAIDAEGTVEHLSHRANHKYESSDYYDKPWNPVSYNFFNDRVLFYRYAPKAPAPKKEDKPAEVAAAAQKPKKQGNIAAEK